MENTYVPITEINPIAVAQTEGKCVCDECKSTFEPKDTLTQKANNISFQGLLGIKGFTKGKDTYYLFSPCCKHLHLFGFDMTAQ
jgi:hypothetical protein